jgi:hypothetical protein
MAGANFNIFSIAIPVLGGLFVASLWYLLDYLQQTHPTTWDGLGRPSFRSPNSRNDFLELFRKWGPAAKFIYLSPAYAALGDTRLAMLIWSIRAQVLANLALRAVEIVSR